MAILKNKKGKKVNVNDRVKQGITTIAVGAGMQVVDKLLGETAGEMATYAQLGIGIALPILVPGTERVGDAVAAVASYKTAQQFDLAGKLGIEGVNNVQGLEDRSAIGNSLFVEKKKHENNNPVSFKKATGGDNPIQ
jgi:hypothetical protein